MKEIMTVGMDIAKSVCHVIGLDDKEREVTKKMLKRPQVLSWFANLPPCLIGIEACAGAHEWARRLQAMGHEVRLIPPQYVKAYLRGNKNDYNDARAIAEAVLRPGMRFVAIKTVEQQDIQALHRLRAAAIGERTALCNRLRGLLAEYGVVLPQGVATFRRRIPELLEDGENTLTPLFRRLLDHGYRQLLEVDDNILFYTGFIEEQGRNNEAEQHLRTVPGYGPIVASVFYATVGNGQAYHRGRDVSASLGLVPRQHSSGGKEVLLGISKRGDSYLRGLLVHAARAVLRTAHLKEDRLSRWAVKIKTERGANKAAVALANKLARIGWAVLRHNTIYQTA